MKITPGKPLSECQKTGLEWVARLHGNRDIVFAVDLTESVGINDKGRIHLRQLVSDSLKPGDVVHVVPFASKVILPEEIIIFQEGQDVDTILEKIPDQADFGT